MPLKIRATDVWPTENFDMRIQVRNVSIDTEPLLWVQWLDRGKDLLEFNDIDQEASVRECTAPDRLARTLATRFGVLSCHVGQHVNGGAGTKPRIIRERFHRGV